MEVLKEGQLFAGRYRVLRRLAEGGMGAVYVALQEATQLEVALKVLWPHILQRKEAVDRFALEAKISARIRSEHIVQVFDAGFDQETAMPFLVMELLRGSTLQSLVEQRGALPPTEALELLAQAARGLDRAHAYKDADGQPAPVIHRDLKPDNLFVSRRENGEPLVKILDYGIAKILSQSTSLSREIKGTPLYMAYEQAVGQPLSPQTDLWALGLIAYFILTGENYWRSAHSEHSELNTLISEIVALPLAPASSRLSERPSLKSLPAGFDDWFQRCVNRDPKARFPSAGVASHELNLLFTSPSAATSARIANAAFDSTAYPTSSVGVVSSRDMAQSAAQSALGHMGGTSPTVRSAGTSSSTGAISPATVSQTLLNQKSKWQSAAALVGIGVLGVVMFFLFSRTQDSEAQDATPAAVIAPVAPQSLSGSVRISPANATVKVNGTVQPLVDGKLLLQGPQGAQFTIEVSLADLHKTQQIKLTSQDTLEPAEIVLDIPLQPAASAAPPPPPDQATATSKPMRPVVRPTATTTKRPATPAVTPPQEVVKPAAVKPRPKEKFDPLAGPRVH